MRFFSLVALAVCLLPTVLSATTGRYRLAYRDDPATTAVLGWSGNNAIVYYDTVDHGQNWQAYAQNRMVDRSVNHRGMNNFFVRFTGLQPSTVYYFVVRDQVDTTLSPRMSFRTLSDNPSDPISFISGGDSRKGVWPAEICDCRDVRQEGMRLVAKIRPDFVAFNGDFVINTPLLADGEWQDWLDDWQLTIGPGGRLSAMVPSVGNHETEADLYNLFDMPREELYYAIQFGGGLFRFYSLNSEQDACTDTTQLNWFANDLAQHSSTSNQPHWKILQYHIPMLPQAQYPQRQDMMNCWLPLLAPHGVRLVMESHAHILKTTYPLVPESNASAPGYYAGFRRDDSLGAVFIGDGSWGAPLRSPYTKFPTTRGTEAKNAFFFVRVVPDSIQVKTVLIEAAASVTQLNDEEQGSYLPYGVRYWNSPGADLLIVKPRQNVAVEPVASVLPEMEVMPNPATERVRLRFNRAIMGDEALQLEVYDARGRLCQQIKGIQGDEAQLDVSAWCGGVHFVRLIGKKDVRSVKILIAR